MKDMQPLLKFHTDIILKNMYKLGTVHVTDFANDLDYYQQLRFTRKGQNGGLTFHICGNASHQIKMTIYTNINSWDA